MQPHTPKTPNSQGLCLIAGGANLPGAAGASLETLNAALELLGVESLMITSQSRFYQTKAIPKGTGPDFVNFVVTAQTNLTKTQTLAALHRIETSLGRQRIKRWGPRTVDLDLLDYNGAIHPDLETYTKWRLLPLAAQQSQAPEQLILPHPRIQDRGFVLIPLNDVAPEWIHPVLGLTSAQMIARLHSDELAGINPL